MAFYPSFNSHLVDRLIENARPAEQLGECFHYFYHGGKNNLVHRFRLSLAGVGIEVDPVSVVTEHKHLCLWERIAWYDPRLSHQVRSTLATGAQIQNMCVPIVVGERSHWLIRRPATSLTICFSPPRVP